MKRVSFQNKSGYSLKALLDLPAGGLPDAYAIFAHCFTCTKNLGAVRNISRSLTTKGFAVLRFDFTGLGESDGDFEDTNFSSNMEDLFAAAEYLAENYEAPQLMVGHSLGGAAVIAAAGHIPSVKAVATIGAPADPAHVQHIFHRNIDEIENNGEAEVNIGGRHFRVKKQFIDDLNDQEQAKRIRNLKRALLILHSPQDEVVEVENAKIIYEKAKHPKSFISLDGADHLLSNKNDARYVGDLIASWAARYLCIEDDDELTTDLDVVAKLEGEKYTTEIKAGKHFMIVDEPRAIGGLDLGPSPYEYLSTALASCTAITMKMYADRKGWPVEEIRVHVKHDKVHSKDMEGYEDENVRIDHFTKHIELKGDLTDQQKKRMVEIASKCPVHKSLHTPNHIDTELIN